MADTSLRARAVHALSWSFLQEFSRRSLQFVIGIVLARLLSPAEFGLLGMLSIFIAVAQALLDGGFGSALIQRKRLSEYDRCSVFYFNLALGFLLWGLFWLVAPAIAAFYEQPQLTPLTRALMVILAINGFALIQRVQLARRLDFKKQALVSTSATALSGLIAVGAAWRGWGVWSLVIQQIANSLIRTGLFWMLSTWRPGSYFSFRALRRLFGFGSRMLASTLLNSVFENLYQLVIGKAFSAIELGFYTRARNLQDTASHTLGTVAHRVTFPLFSTLQGEPGRLREGLRKAITTIAFVQFPVMLGLAAVAEPLVLVLLTDKWAPCIPYVQLLCLSGVLYPVHLLNLNAVVALGRSDVLFRLELVKRLLILISIAVTVRWGVLALIAGQVVFGIVSYFLNSYFCNRIVGYSTRQQVADLGPYLAVSALMGGGVLALGHLLTLPPILELAILALAGSAFYLAGARVLQFPAVAEVGRILSRIPRGRRLRRV